MTDALKPRSFLNLFIRHGGFGLLFPIVCGGIAGMIGFYSAREASDFAFQGRSTSAVVVSTSLRESRGPGSGNNFAIPDATVRFSVDGKEVLAAGRISQASFETLQPGDAIDIRYLPDDPQRIEVDAGISLTAALITGGVALLALGALVFVAGRAARFARGAITVRQRGKRTLVKVAEHRVPTFGNDRKPKTRLVWQDSNGRENLSLPVTMDVARKYRVGRKIAIYELPGSDLGSVWEGDVGHP